MDRLAAIEIFIRVVDTGSFSAAARHLDIGQPHCAMYPFATSAGTGGTG
ncbi:regulatory helix-turn-helix LysR family protein [Paraburkholderia sp. BL10I2N1]|nr:regulatory helix-turn-helix LysR family protein [Paraburkholderia sp. BL10I2N1]